VEIDPETGRSSDGGFYPTAKLTALAGEWLVLQQRIQDLEAELRKPESPEQAKVLRRQLSAAVQNLSAIEEQRRAERERLNKLRFPEQCR
jgi:hypothetical protein